MRSRMLGVIVVAAVFSVAAHAEDLTSVFLAKYAVADDRQRAALERDAALVYSGIAWADLHSAKIAGRKPTFCEPSKLAMTGAQAVDILRQSAKVRAGTDVPFGLEMLYGMIKTFPCE